MNPRPTWRSVEFLIAFWNDKSGKRRAKPYLWSPKGAFAKLLEKVTDRQAVVVVRGKDGSDDDVQIKMQQDKIVLRRSNPFAWDGIVVTDHAVDVRVGEVWITIRHDGSVARKDACDISYLEADGAMLKQTPISEVFVSGDGVELTRRTKETIAAITADGFVAKARK